MSGCAPTYSCEVEKDLQPLCLRHDKDKKVRLAHGVLYAMGTLLTTGKDADATVWSAWAIGDEVKGIVKCDEDLTSLDVPCPTNVMVQGCVNAAMVNWPTSEDEAEQATINAAIQELIATESCCLVFEYLAGECE